MQLLRNIHRGEYLSGTTACRLTPPGTVASDGPSRAPAASIYAAPGPGFIRGERSPMLREARPISRKRPLHRTRSARISAALARFWTNTRPPSLYLFWVAFPGDLLPGTVPV